jgi:hypothetical protein
MPLRPPLRPPERGDVDARDLEGRTRHLGREESATSRTRQCRRLQRTSGPRHTVFARYACVGRGVRPNKDAHRGLHPTLRAAPPC